MGGKPKTPDHIVKEAVALYKGGMSSVPIGKKLGIDPTTVLKYAAMETTIRPSVCDHHDPVHDRDSRRAVQYAITKGLMKRPDDCEACGCCPELHKNGTPGIHAHHDDYNFPLSIRWLCIKCHYAWHKQNVPVHRNPDKEIDLSFLYRGYVGPKRTRNFKSKHRGVSWNAKESKWITTIRVKGKTIYLGLSKKEDEAAAKYKKAAEKYFGLPKLVSYNTLELEVHPNGRKNRGQ